MHLKIKDLQFLGEEAIMMIDFLARFVGEANIGEMSEPQVFVALLASSRDLLIARTEWVSRWSHQEKAEFRAGRRWYSTC